MNYQEFLHEVRRNIRNKIPKESTVLLRTVVKNNDQKFDTIIIFNENQRITPNIYLNQYYNEFIDGRSLDEIADSIINIHCRSDYPREALSDISDFDNVSKHIFYSLVNKKANEERIKDIPYKDIGDLAKIYKVATHMDKDGVASFIISKELIKKWNVDINTIDSIANINTPALFPFTLKGISELINELLLDLNKADQDNRRFISEDIGYEESIKMYVLSNNIGIGGASSMLYKGVLKNFATQVNANLYILPSSIHEVIIIPAIYKFNVSDMREMVIEVNKSIVDAGEVLSNEIYFYDNNNDEICIVEKQ